MTDNATRMYRYLLHLLGIGVGTLSTSLAFEIAPWLVEFRDGIDPTLQGAVTGAAIVLMVGVTAVMVEVEE